MLSEYQKGQLSQVFDSLIQKDGDRGVYDILDALFDDIGTVMPNGDEHRAALLNLHRQMTEAIDNYRLRCEDAGLLESVE